MVDDLRIYSYALDHSDIFDLAHGQEHNRPPVVSIDSLNPVAVNQVVQVTGSYEDAYVTDSGVHANWEVVDGPGNVTFYEQ